MMKKQYVIYLLIVVCLVLCGLLYKLNRQVSQVNQDYQEAKEEMTYVKFQIDSVYDHYISRLNDATENMGIVRDTVESVRTRLIYRLDNIKVPEDVDELRDELQKLSE